MSKALTKALFELEQRYPKERRLDETRTVAYLADLADLPEDAVIAAMRRLGRASTFFPSVAEIRRAAVEDMGEASGVWIDPAAAWAEVMGMARRFGVEGRRTAFREREDGTWETWEEELAWSSPAIGYAVAVMGWRELCLMERGGKEERTMYAQFRDALKAEQQRFREAVVEGRTLARPAFAIPGAPSEAMTAIGDVVAGMIAGPDDEPSGDALARMKNKGQT